MMNKFVEDQDKNDEHKEVVSIYLTFHTYIYI